MNQHLKKGFQLTELLIQITENQPAWKKLKAKVIKTTRNASSRQEREKAFPTFAI